MGLVRQTTMVGLELQNGDQTSKQPQPHHHPLGQEVVAATSLVNPSQGNIIDQVFGIDIRRDSCPL